MEGNNKEIKKEKSRCCIIQISKNPILYCLTHTESP